MKAPFPYFGGKSSVASVVWQALGDPAHYVEPFFGSGAVLLNRPIEKRSSVPVETICDKDGFVCNAWRGIKYDPDEVAKWCDWPVNHADLCARRRRLIANEDRLLENLIADDEWFDAKLAGYWVWAASCWIGSGLTRLNARPHLSNKGMGVHAIGQMPHLSDGGTGVHAIGKRPHLSHGGKGVHATSSIHEWFAELSTRFRYVRVVCGDWTRVCGGNWQTEMGVCGMFFDPPYGVTDRRNNIYHHDSVTVARDVEEWCLRRGEDRSMRIVVAGYEGEYQSLEAAKWRVVEWKTGGGYGKLGNGRGSDNRHRERLWFSPHCLRGHEQRELF